MEPYQSYTRHIQPGSSDSAAPRGIAAFFDLDGTLIDSHSVKDIFTERLLAGQVSAAEIADLLNMVARYALKAGSFEDALSGSVRNLAGQPAKHFEELGEKVYRDRLAAVVFPEMKAVVRRHRALGHRLVLVTSATTFQAEPLARSLGIDHVLCTRLQQRKGRYTGALDGPACYGPAKVGAAHALADAEGLSLEHSYFYSNGSEDLPLLHAVGHPVAVNADRELRRQARKEGWTILVPAGRGSTGLGDVARTLTTFGSVLPSLLATLPLRWLAGEREAVNLSLALWGGLASAVAGLKLMVEGEQHLWARRPAVFLFNHQSAMDVLIMTRLIRENVVGVAKQEIRRQPFLGPAMSLTGSVFIDRSGARNPKQALQPAVEALGNGLSVAIAPEGTRSKDGSLGPFKTGAFHLAAQAGVPVVPVVIHNALDALPNRSMIVRPAEVQVTVLKPIDATGWTRRQVALRCHQVRRAYLETLGLSLRESG